MADSTRLRPHTYRMPCVGCVGDALYDHLVAQHGEEPADVYSCAYADVLGAHALAPDATPNACEKRRHAPGDRHVIHVVKHPFDPSEPHRPRIPSM